MSRSVPLTQICHAHRCLRGAVPSALCIITFLCATSRCVPQVFATPPTPQVQGQRPAQVQSQPVGSKKAVPAATPVTVPEAPPLAPQFNQDRAWRDLQEIVKRGQRYYGAPQREEAIQALVNHLEAAGGAVSLQRFTQREPQSKVDYQLTNVIARFNPEISARVILGSHWDTRLWAEEDADIMKRQMPITGANDGSSGVAVLFEIARQIQALKLQGLGVDIVLFDGEEFGRPGSQDYCAGSRYFARNLQHYYPKEQPRGVVVIDMVGDRELTFPPEQSSVAKARALTTLIWREGVRLSAPAFIAGLRRPQRGGPRSRWIVDDHTPFQELGIPAVLIIDLDYAQWHTHQDTLDRVSAASLKQTGDVLLASLTRLDEQVRALQSP